MAVSVLHILGTSSIEGTGIVRIVENLARSLERKYLHYALFQIGDGVLASRLEREGIACITVDPRASVLGLVRLLKTVRDIRPQIVHQHAGGPRLTRAIRWLSDAKLLVHVHGTVDESTMTEPGMIAPAGADLVIASSRYVANRIVHRDCRVIHAGVDIDVASRRNGSDNSVVVGTAGRLVRTKGHIFLIRAISALLSDFPNLRLELCGDGPERSILECEAMRLECSHAVKFLGWRDDFPGICDGWDVFAFPSLAEAFGIAALEAMAMGLPVVASDVGGIGELVEPGNTGLLVRPGDADALAGALRELLADGERRAAMGTAGQVASKRRFSAKRMADETEAVYRTLIGVRH